MNRNREETNKEKERKRKVIEQAETNVEWKEEKEGERKQENALKASTSTLIISDVGKTKTNFFYRKKN